MQIEKTHLIFRTPLSGDLDLRFFGVLLPISIKSISCVKPVLAVDLSWKEPSPSRLKMLRFRLIPLQKRNKNEMNVLSVNYVLTKHNRVAWNTYVEDR